MEEEEFKSQCIVRLEKSRWHSDAARQRACAKPNALRESDNNHGAGSSEAAQAAGICHRQRSRTHSKVNTEIGLFADLYGLEDNNKTKTDGELNGQQHSHMGQCWGKVDRAAGEYSMSAAGRSRITQPCH